MRFIKAVASKFFDQIKDLYGQSGIDTLCRRTLFKDAALLGHLLRFFLTHRPAEQIGTTQRVARQHLRNLHHLLLIQNDAVGRL